MMANTMSGKFLDNIQRGEFKFTQKVKANGHSMVLRMYSQFSCGF